MKRITGHILRCSISVGAAILLAVAFAAGQKVYTPSDVPNVHLPDAGRYVSDPENILSASAVSRLNSIAAQMEASRKIETAIVVIPSIGNDTPESFTVDLFQRWGIGKSGEDNGLLILLATEDRLVRFEVGYGLEGELTDAMSKRIQTQRMNPYFIEGDWGEGLIAGLTAIQELLTDPTSELHAPEAEYGGLFSALLAVMGIAVLVMILAVFAQRRARKCPRCGHRMEVAGQTSRTISPGVKMTSTVLRCPNCGYTTTKNTTQNIGGAVIGGTLAGGMGRGFGGGGFGGGFGGGRSGGGGATSRF
ncbi:MAG: TPM domain-containing protein [Rikenellaceae bacterium]|nr:TPM domain-containing protein [Rikenellaceae bacterium]